MNVRCLFFGFIFFWGSLYFGGKFKKKKRERLESISVNCILKFIRPKTVLNKSSCGVYFTDNDVSGLSPIYIRPPIDNAISCAHTRGSVFIDSKK